MLPEMDKSAVDMYFTTMPQMFKFEILIMQVKCDFVQVIAVDILITFTTNRVTRL